MSEQHFWSRSRVRALSRRRLLTGAGTAGLGLAAAALVGCGTEDEGGPPGGGAPAATPQAAGAGVARESGQPKSGGTFANARMPNYNYQHYDPHAAVFSSDFTWPSHSLLATHDISNPDQAQWTIEPDAAASWEEPDPATFVFHLADNLNFHDIPPANGRAATSEDVKASIERMNTKEPQFFRQHEFRDATIETPDDRTVVFKFPNPNAAFWNRITSPGTVIVPPEMYEQEGRVLFASGDPFPGTGPFMNHKFVQDQSYTVERNPAYFKEGRPYLDRIDARFYQNAEAQFVGFRARDIDYVVAANRDHYDEALQMPDVTVDRRVGLQNNWVIFQTEKPPFDDARVRRALSLAAPRQEIVAVAHRGEDDGVLAGPGGLMPTVHGTATWTYEELKTRPGYRSGGEREQDIAEARRLLDAAGFAETARTMPFINSVAYGEPIVTLLQDAWAELGFTCTLETRPYSDLLVVLAGRDFDIVWTAQFANSLDANELIQFYFADGAVRNYGNWKHGQYNELLAKQNLAVDAEERNQVIREMVEILEEEVPRATLTNQTTKVAMHNYLHGWHGTYGWATENIPDRIWVDK